MPTTQTPSTTKPFLSHISGIKPASLPHYIDLFDESAYESAEENPLHLDELKSPPSSPEDPKKVNVDTPNPHSRQSF